MNPSIKITKSNKILYLIFIINIFIMSSCSLAPQNSETIISGIYFDTFVSITLYDNENDNVVQEIKSTLTYYDELLSESNLNSDIYKINNNINNIINPETQKLILDSLEFAKLSDGKLDPTIEGVSALYNFDTSEHDFPSKDSISNALLSVDYKSISIANNTLIKNNPDTKICLGFIAKGYISDKLKEILAQNNIKGGLINLGGNILTYGEKNDKSDFIIGIEKPFREGESAVCLKIAGDTTVVTSGVYERYFTNNNKTYSHIINTSTGYPISNNLYSVSVIGPSSETADALSTLLLIEGYNDSEYILNNYPEYQAIYVFEDYSIKYSKNFNKDIIFY